MAQPVPDFDHDKAIHTYQQLITELPSLNRQLLLYILDLLAVFASKSDVNLMTSANLAAIFQPGLLSHPNHDMSPQEYRLSQDVLIFLVDNQDSFLIGMSGTAVDEQTVREVQAGAPPRQQTATPKATQTGLGRSASNASAGADSRRFSGIRRNISVSSRGSKHSSTQGPATPSSGVFAPSGGGVYRSNTVPSKKSPALSSKRYARGVDSPNTPLALSPGLASSARSTSPAKSSLKVPESQGQSSSQASSPTIDRSLAPSSTTAQASETSGHSSERLIPSDSAAGQVTSKQSPNLRPPIKTRKVSDILSNAISGSASDKEPGRQPNKLRKKRAPSGLHPSAHSSSNSLTAGEDSSSEGAFRTPMMTPGVGTQAMNRPILEAPAQGSEGIPAKNDASHSQADLGLQAPRSPAKLQDAQKPSEMTLKAKSPPNSVHSRSSVTDLSEQDHNDDLRPEGSEKKKGRWRFSHSTKKDAAAQQSRSPARVGANAGAEKSSSSISSWHKSRKSMSNDGPSDANEPVPAIPPQHVNTDESKSKDSEEHQEGGGEKKGFFGKIKAKVSHAREERKERESEKERAKSPSRDTERSGSKQSLSAIANDALPVRGRSIDLSQQPIPEATAEKEGEQSEAKAVAS